MKTKDYIYIRENLWGNLSKKISDNVITSEDIINIGDLNWNVASTRVYTKYHPSVYDYHLIYKDDESKTPIGVVNKNNPILIQNVESFRLIEGFLGNSLEVETCGHVDGNRNIFGCFKLNADFKIFDDNIDVYVVILNDHLKVDGKVTIFYTPIRIVCQNTLSYALSKAVSKIRVPVSCDFSINRELTSSILDHIDECNIRLNRIADKYINLKIDRNDIDSLLDELFPMVESNGARNKHNDQMEIARELYLTRCLESDNLSNYRGTGYSVFNASMDFYQHYYTNIDKCYDLTYRMSLLPGRGSDERSYSMNKTVSFLNKLISKKAA